MSLRFCLLSGAVLALSLSGCGAKPDARQFSEQDDVDNVAPPEAHHHPEHGPNGGHVVVLGDHAFHAELVFDADTRNVTVYLLEHDMATATPVADATMSLNLEGAEPVAFESAPADGDPEGQSSQFTLSGDKLPESVHDEEDLHGSLVLTVGGQDHSGMISHDHGHGHDGHADHDEHEGEHHDDHKGE